MRSKEKYLLADICIQWLPLPGRFFPVANSVPSPSIVFTLLLPALVSWGIMTEAGLWFVFCLLSPLPQREETLHGLFSTPRRKIYPPKAGEYCTIVVLEKKSINFLPSWLHFRMIQTWWVQAAVWQSLPSKDWNLKGNESLIQQNQIFFSRHLLFWFLLFLVSLGKATSFGNSVIWEGAAPCLSLAHSV